MLEEQVAHYKANMTSLFEFESQKHSSLKPHGLVSIF